MSMDIKLYEYEFGNNYRDTDSHRSMTNCTSFNLSVLDYSVTPINTVSNYLFNIPNNNGTAWKSMSYGSGSITITYLITLGTGASIEANISEFINNYIGYYSINDVLKYNNSLVLVNTLESTTYGHRVVFEGINTVSVSDSEAILVVNFIKLNPYMISRTMLGNAGIISDSSTISIASGLTVIDSPLLIRIEFGYGAVTNPMLVDENNKYLRLVEQFSGGSSIIIDCESNTVTLNSGNGMYALDISSTFLQLNSVNNTLTYYDDDVNDCYINISLHSHKLY